MNIPIELIKKLRKETSAGVSDCKKALAETNNDYDAAIKLLNSWGLEKAKKKQSRDTSQGVIASYVHNDSVGVLVELRCETDFVARTKEFKELAHEITLQVAAMNPKSANTLLKSEYVRDSSLTIEALIKLSIAKLGENITVGTFNRMAMGE